MPNIIDIIRQFTLNSREIGINALFALIILVIGILLGKFFKLILKRASKKLKLDKIFKYGGVEIALTIVKWAIYLFFIGFAIEQLDIPYLSTSFATAISIIPKSIGALVILVIGFALGKFLQKTIQNAQKDWFLLADILLYFFIYLSLTLSIQLVFVSNLFLSNWISLVFTIFYLIFLVLFYGVKKKK